MNYETIIIQLKRDIDSFPTRNLRLALKRKRCCLTLFDCLIKYNEAKLEILIDIEKERLARELFRKIKTKIFNLRYVVDSDYIDLLQNIGIRDKVRALQQKIDEIQSSGNEEAHSTTIEMLKDVREFIITECGFEDEFN